QAQIEAIVADPAPADFDNTLLPLERSGRILDRVSTVFFSMIGTDETPRLLEIQERWTARLAEHHDRILLNPDLHARIAAVRARLGADLGDPSAAEQRRLVEVWHRRMTLAGAGLDDAARQELSALNQRIAELTAAF